MASILAIELADLAFALTEVGWWTTALAITAFVLIIERRPLASLGFQPVSLKTVWVAIVGLILATLLVGISVTLANLLGVDFSNSQERLEDGTSVPIFLLGLTILRAGIVEELLFRGLLITRIIELRASPIVAVLIATAVFVAPHALFWPGPHLLIVAAAGLSFGIIFIWKRDLVACMIAHVGFNGLGYILSAI